MTEKEYKEIYAKHASESGVPMSAKGFAEFMAWRERVDKFFDAMGENTS